MLLEIFKRIPDHRRKQSQQFDLAHLLLFSVLAVVSGCHSYRMIHSFIKTHFNVLQKHYGLEWKRVPAYSTIRYVIHSVDEDALEQAFREHARKQSSSTTRKHISVDGKMVRKSFDYFNDKRALHILGALLTQENIIIAHEMIGDKTSEVLATQQLIKKLGLNRVVYTMDALHCQKKRCKQ
jgi:hypothetical protein